MRAVVIYRQADNADVQGIKELARRVISINYVPFLGEDTTTAFIESGMADKEIDEGRETCTVMLCDGQMIGFAITKQALLHLIMIDVAFQNAGYGSLLLAHVEERQFLKFSRLSLQTFEANTAAARFYLKNGWEITMKEKIPEMDQSMLHFEKNQRPQ